MISNITSLKVAVLQSNYLPWRGYFDLINDVDLVVFYDDVQYTKNDWRNRNRIVTTDGLRWLTVPVGSSIHRKICDVTVPNTNWRRKHFHAIQHAYAKSLGMELYGDYLGEILKSYKYKTLSGLNQALIRNICMWLDISTAFDDSRNYSLHGNGQGRLMDLLAKVNATDYVSGPAGRNYLDSSIFKQTGITLTYKDYQGYPYYRQRDSRIFEPMVSVVDTLMNCGRDAAWYVYGWHQDV
jgi:hypothetical protein